jgi:hypothetical protein
LAAVEGIVEIKGMEHAEKLFIETKSRFSVALRDIVRGFIQIALYQRQPLEA